ncbi:AP-1 complex subunit beta-1 [Neolecta irregularis DAH-3]|uniref:AP complex subunit beta n=1 Tax=Neolecta irregularis (strain DAH-3) TaxID=1198029 RepID=A0A1U7LIZ1_NEOID|nr:AP-1 complex subunit beta-1 [Neolecta irregularis DAH-3]|eukprot:OLL22491.1 AP-1 complex subunit beta-1 [Neolecta irregularis DAH-3]
MATTTRETSSGTIPRKATHIRNKSRQLANVLKGETFELRSGLVSQYAYERKEAIQRTIAAMTLGKDVSALFPDVLKNIATHDLAQKKLVYLYLMNYAKTHPDLCILAVNTFVQDSEDPNPLVRALAIRTMGCIRDESPYVRKTAAICVAKLFDLNPEMAIENGFINNLQELLGDGNPMVVANAVQALSEIQETAPETRALRVSSGSLSKLLIALNECTEWGRIAVLTSLANYKTTDATQAEHICERVVPQFQHANAGVVMSAVKVILMHLETVGEDMQRQLLKKMAPPLVTLLSTAPEVQYVALRNINLILQKYPEILGKELRVFFCKYNDPEYVKFEKLEIMIKLANEKNMDQLLMELKEYASEVDVEFVRRAVRAIGQCAIKLNGAAERCINVLLDLINTKVNYVVQEAVVVIKDIFRKYPSCYEGIIPQLCENIDELDDPAAQGALIWIIGEYAERIENANELLSMQVQLQLLAATVKLFLKKPKMNQELVQKMLQTATSECDNPDLRDRAYIYWRLLSSSPEISKDIVLAPREPISSNGNCLSPQLLREMIAELSTLAAVYHRPASTFLKSGSQGVDDVQQQAIDELKQIARENPIQPSAQKSNIENLLDFELDPSPIVQSPDLPSAQNAPVASSATPTSTMDDLFSMFNSNSNAQTQNAPTPKPGTSTTPPFDALSLHDNLWESTPAPNQQPQNHQSAEEDMLGLF